MPRPSLDPVVCPSGRRRDLQTRNRSDPNPRRGLTLVELLVVMAMMVVLAGMLFPILARLRAQAHQTTCLSNLRQIAQSHLLYLQDWDEQFPYWYLAAPPRPQPFGPHLYWTEYLQPYLANATVFRDPSAHWQGATAGKLADYVLLTWGPGGRGTPEDPYYRWPGPPLSLADVRRPAETISVLDGWSTTGGSVSDGWDDSGWGNDRPLRHGRGTNASFLDGHVRWLPAGTLPGVQTDGRGFYWLRYGTADR